MFLFFLVLLVWLTNRPDFSRTGGAPKEKPPDIEAETTKTLPPRVKGMRMGLTGSLNNCG